MAPKKSNKRKAEAAPEPDVAKPTKKPATGSGVKIEIEACELAAWAQVSVVQKAAVTPLWGCCHSFGSSLLLGSAMML